MREEKKKRLTTCKTLRIFNNTPFDFGMQLRHTLIVKGNLSTNQHVQNNTKTPDIDFRPGVLSRLEQLGRGKVQTATKSLE